MYTETNFKTKKALKEAVASGESVRVYQPGPFNQGFVDSGDYSIEGPHYPKPHRWYARVTVVDGSVTKVK